jgi:predicted porin
MPYSLYLGNYRIKLAPAYMGYRTNGAPALGYASTSVDISRKFESHYFNHFLGGGYKYTQKSSLDDSFDSYAGDSHNATLTYSARWSRRSLRARIGFYANNYSTEDTLDEFSEDLIDSVILGESNSHSGYYFDASYRVYSGKFAMAFRGHVKSFEYEENTFDNSVRRDTNYRVGGTLDYHLSKSIDLYVRSEYTFNDSNMETEEVDHNYHLFMNSVGMRIHF